MGREFEVEGTVTPGYESVRDRFARNWEDFDEVGAAYALYVDGEKVVDIWSGTLDRDTDEPYVADTLQLVFSATKGATAACAALLADRGELDVDLPVAHYWPEFAQAGKERIPVRYLLSHKAGLPTFEGALTAEEMLAWDPVIRRLEESAPVWEPGARHGYHAITYGYLVGEVVRRISGKSLGTFFRNEFAEPLGLEFWIGLPEEHFSRVAPLVDQFGSETAGDPEAAAEMSKMMSETLLGRALTMNGAMNGLDGGINAPAAWSAEIPAANGVTNARSLARLYASLIGGVQDGPSVALWRCERVVRAPGGGRFTRLRRSGPRHRRGLRHEPHVAGSRGGLPLRRAHRGELQSGGSLAELMPPAIIGPPLAASSASRIVSHIVWISSNVTVRS